MSQMPRSVSGFVASPTCTVSMYAESSSEFVRASVQGPALMYPAAMKGFDKMATKIACSAND